MTHDVLMVIGRAEVLLCLLGVTMGKQAAASSGMDAPGCSWMGLCGFCCLFVCCDESSDFLLL